MGSEAFDNITYILLIKKVRLVISIIVHRVTILDTKKQFSIQITTFINWKNLQYQGPLLRPLPLNIFINIFFVKSNFFLNLKFEKIDVVRLERHF